MSVTPGEMVLGLKSMWREEGVFVRPLSGLAWPAEIVFGLLERGAGTDVV